LDEQTIHRNILRNKINKRSNVKECFCFDQGGCNKVIVHSHTLQENGVLDLIEEDIDSNMKLFSFDNFSLRNEEMLQELEAIGKAKAVTFTGFCGNHDNDLFKPIENGKEFNVDSIEHCFLQSLRSLARFFYRLKKSINVFHDEKYLEMLTLNQLALNENRIKSLKRRESSLNLARKIFLKGVKENDFSRFEFIHFRLKMRIKLATATVQFIPPSNKSFFIYSAIPSSNSISIIFAALKRDRNAINHLRKLKIIMSKRNVQPILSFYLLNSSTVLAPSLWNSINFDAQKLLINILTNNQLLHMYNKNIFNVDFKFLNLFKAT